MLQCNIFSSLFVLLVKLFTRNPGFPEFPGPPGPPDKPWKWKEIKHKTSVQSGQNQVVCHTYIIQQHENALPSASVNCKEVQGTSFEKIAANFRQQLIIVRKFARIGTVDVTKMQEISSKYRFKRSFCKKPRKDRGFVEIRLHYVCTILQFAVAEKQQFVCFVQIIGWLLATKV